MRINQNVMANNASRNLSGTNVMLGKSLEKLSSGFRINRAADDAAGLVVSQNLRSQIGGLKQATRNAQDGISVVQTAEGALNEVHTMLGRMRDLAVQAANSGGNDTAARTAAQTEIDQLAQEITRVSDKEVLGTTPWHGDQVAGVGSVALVTILAGLLVLAAGASGLGRAVTFIPWPVIEGFTLGIAAIIFLQQVPAAFGTTAPAGSTFSRPAWR